MDKYLKNMTKKQLFLLGIFVIAMILNLFFSPWEKDMTVAFNEMFEKGDSVNQIVNNAFSKVFFYGVFDWLKMWAYSLYKMNELMADYAGDWGMVTFLVLGICLGAFILFRFVADYLEDLIVDTDTIWKKTLEIYFLESALTYIFCLCTHFLINGCVKSGLMWLYLKHPMLLAILSILFMFFGVWMLVSICVIIGSYSMVICFPLIIWGLLTAIPVIGLFFNNIFIAIVWMVIEVFMIFYVWPEYCSKWALRMTMRVAVYPVKCVKKCVLWRKEAVTKSRKI